MVKTKYGLYTQEQLSSIKRSLQKAIYFLLLYVDPKECIKYPDVDVNEAFDNVFYQLMGFNKILLEPPEVLMVMNSLEAARILYNSENFQWQKYRKLILDAGSKIMEVGEHHRNN